MKATKARKQRLSPTGVRLIALVESQDRQLGELRRAARDGEPTDAAARITLEARQRVVLAALGE